MNFIDKILNKITMYRLTLYILGLYIIVAEILSWYGLVPFSWLELALTFAVLTFFAWLSNLLFAKIFRVPHNAESFYITAFILTLIITHSTDKGGLAFLALVATIAMASKYIISWKRKHLFNPAAFAVVFSLYALNSGASWWVGTLPMLPVVVVGGFLLVRKLKRWSMVSSFLGTAAIVTLGFALYQGTDILLTLKALFLYSATIFFATIMLTEPLTAPPTRKLQVIYGAFVGILYSPFMHVGSFYFTPELALLAGNLFAFVVSSKDRLLLRLTEKKQIGKNLYDFVFALDKKIKFTPGQYMEWTLAHKHHDLRGNRRYFTLASSPTEAHLRIGVKFYEPPSTFKRELGSLEPGATIMAGQLMGDFVLSKNPKEKSVFIAGGIGITPFRSMVKYLIDTNQQRDIVLLYSNKTKEEIVYFDIFDQAEAVGVRGVYTLTGEIPNAWLGERGRISPQMIQKHIPDFTQRVFYVSGTRAMVDSMEKMLRSMGIGKRQIKTDFFPGFA